MNDLATAPKDARTDEHYRCPECGGVLEAVRTGLACVGCGRSYSIDAGIVDLRCRRTDYYFNPVRSADMAALIERLSAKRWHEGIRTFIRHANMNVSWLDNLVTDGRYAWKLFLDLQKDHVVLDLGCGLGNLSKNIAPHVGRLYALDLTYRRLEFARKRFEIFNPADDIRLVAGGDGRYLPFADASMDCVIVSGVLEWVGEGDSERYEQGSKSGRAWRMVADCFGARSPRVLQRDFLKEIGRILKPDGQLFVAIENRTNLEYFGGRPDHHSALLGGSLLPRFLANLYSIARAHRPYRTYTYSMPGYRRLFAQAGFTHCEFLGFLDGYSSLHEILASSVRARHWRPERPVGLKERLRRHPRLVPAYGIIAKRRSSGEARLQDRILTAIASALGGDASEIDRLIIRRYQITAKEKAVIRGEWDGQPIVIRIPLNPSAEDCARTNDMMLQRMKANPDVANVVPRPLAAGVVSGVRFFVEEGKPGVPLSKAFSGMERTELLAATGALLDKLNARSRRLQPLVQDAFRMHVSEPLERVLVVAGEPEIESPIREFFERRVGGMNAPVGVLHGDFGAPNLLMSGASICGVVDWEAGELEGVSLVDAINLLLSLRLLEERTPFDAGCLVRLANWEWPHREDLAFLEARYRAAGFEAAHHSSIVYLTWLKAVDLLLRFDLGYDPIRMKRMVVDVMRVLTGRSDAH